LSCSHWPLLFPPFGSRFCEPQDGRSSSTSRSRPPTPSSQHLIPAARERSKRQTSCKEGITTRVAVFTDPPSGEDHEFIRRGLPYEDASAWQIRQRGWLGVTNIVQIARTDAGTEGEGQALPRWCDQHQLRSIVFMAAGDHSRRLRWVLDRIMKGHPTRVTVRPARYSSFDPDRWWETRGGIRTEIVELQKLVFEDRSVESPG
jgi:hypothetical protein